jgi:hypothetical protein
LHQLRSFLSSISPYRKLVKSEDQKRIKWCIKKLKGFNNMELAILLMRKDSNVADNGAQESGETARREEKVWREHLLSNIYKHSHLLTVSYPRVDRSKDQNHWSVEHNFFFL